VKRKQLDMNLNIEIHKENMTGAFHKAKGFNCTKSKNYASKDISKECGIDGFYSRNYIGLESKVLQYSKINLTTRTIDLKQY